MIDWSKVEVERQGTGRYAAFDRSTNEMLLDVSRQTSRAGKKRVQIYDVHGTSGKRLLLRTVDWNENSKESELTDAVLSCLDMLVCMVCSTEWGPVCKACFEEAADQAFLDYRELRREYGEPSKDS